MAQHEREEGELYVRDLLGPIGKIRAWHIISCRFIGPILAIVGLILAFVSEGWPYYLSRIVGTIAIIALVVGAILFVISLLAPVAVFYERRNLPKDREWYPSRWYYLMVFPDGLLALVLAAVYTSRRRRYF